MVLLSSLKTKKVFVLNISRVKRLSLSINTSSVLTMNQLKLSNVRI